MSIIQLSPQLHQAVKSTKVQTFNDSPYFVQSLSIVISTSESKAMLKTFSDGKSIQKQLEVTNYWG